jgi:hypothetical protein
VPQIELLFRDSDSEWSDSEDADMVKSMEVRTAVPVSVVNDKINYWNELYDV